MASINEISSLPGSMQLTRNLHNTNGSGFIYKILPLNTNLSRKPTDTVSKEIVNTKTFKLGDYVKGKSINDNKWYKGKISRILLKGENKIAYILKNSNNIIIPVLYNSLKYVNIDMYNSDIKEKINTNILKDYSMNSDIKQLILEYFEDQNTLLQNLLKKCDKEQKKYDKLSGPRKEFIIGILGKNTYNKYTSGEFAPVPLSSFGLTINDFEKILKEPKKDPDMDKVKKFISEFKKFYHSNDVNFVNNGITLALQTNIIFLKLDDVIDFFSNMAKTYKKVYKSNDLDWSILVKKFRNYLK